MPRRPRRDKRRLSGVDVEDVKFALRVADFFDDFTEEQLHEAWRRFRAELLAECEPFERPTAWWNYEAPEPPREIKCYYGFGPDGWGTYDSPEGLRQASPTHRSESLREYLRRHPDLATDEERRILEAELS